MLFNSGFFASLGAAALAASTAIASALPPRSPAAGAPPPLRSIRSPYSYPSSPGSSRGKPTAQEVIDVLGLVPSNEKGYYSETFRDADLVPDGSGRSVSTAIYYLLEGADAYSYWHRVDASEVWHYYAGAPLSLYLALDDGTPVREHVLGSDLFAGEQGQRPQVVIAKDEWQRARSWGNWTLVGTTVAPAFIPEGFELAPPDWEPDTGS